jgi:hypothetical protein
MLGSDKSRGYCLEMICADFLAGAHLDNGDPEILLHSISRYYNLLPGEQQQTFLENLRDTASWNDSPESLTEMVGDVQMRDRIKPQGLVKQLPIMLQELAGITGAGIGDDKADVEITSGICKDREEVRLGEVERDDTVLDTRLPGAFSANRPQQGLSPADQSYMNSCRCDLPCKFLADTGRSARDKCPGAEPFFIECCSHLFAPFCLLGACCVVNYSAANDCGD